MPCYLVYLIRENYSKYGVSLYELVSLPEGKQTEYQLSSLSTWQNVGAFSQMPPAYATTPAWPGGLYLLVL